MKLIRHISSKSRSYQILKELHDAGKIVTLSKEEAAKIDENLFNAYVEIKAEHDALTRKTYMILNSRRY